MSEEAEAAVRARISELTEEIMPQARAEAYKVWQRAPHALEMDELESLALSGLAAAGHRWPEYCEKNGHDPTAYQFFTAYCLRRMRGAMLDYLRTQDWVTRSARTRAKMLRDAGQDRGLSEAELSAATGISIADIRETMAAVSARPVSIDAEPHDVAGSDDVEGSAVVSEVLAAVGGVIAGLSESSRVVLALHYYHGMPMSELAGYVGVSEDEAVRLHQKAILAIHSAMMRAVT
jgi:RNA polymerase sigma factor for flagellar operon FliA